jgi:hypothetical protein
LCRYLTFELIIRICVELRLEVTYAFVAIDVPMRFFLMIADFLLLLILYGNPSDIIRKRLNLKNDWLSHLSKPLAMVAILAIVLVWFGGRVAYVIMMVGYSFRWDQPDRMYYAISRTMFAGGYLLAALMLWVRFLRFWMVYRRRVQSSVFTDRLGKVPSSSSLLAKPTNNLFYRFLSCSPALLRL